MKNILKNLSGGFFRTFGRVLFYVVFGLLIGYFFNSKGLKITDLFDFGMYVNASTTTAWTNSQSRAVFDQQGSTSFGSWRNNTASFDSSYLTYPVKAIQYRMSYSSGLKAENSYTFTIAFKPTPDSIMATSILFWKNSTDILEDFTCDNWKLGTSGTLNTFYYSTCSFSPKTDYTSSDYLYVGVNTTSSYLTYLTTYVSPFEERLGTNAVITNSANNIINNQNNNTNSIINNNNQNTQNIIDNQNANNQALIDSQMTCKTITTNYDTAKNKHMLLNINNGTLIGNNFFNTTDYIRVNNNGYIKVITPIVNFFGYICFYNNDKQYISCINSQNMAVNTQINIPQNTSFMRASIHGSDKPVLEVESCVNNVSALNDTLTDDSAPDVSSLNDMAGWLPAGPLDSILNLPLTLLNSLNTALSGTCQPITMTLPYINEDLTLPCISSIYQEIGAISFVNWVGTIASAFILFKYLMKLYKWVDDTLTFRENNWLDNWGGVD